MGAEQNPPPRAAGADGAPADVGDLALARLRPPGPARSVADAVEELGLQERREGREGRPWVILNMVSTLDGRATLRGRSGPIGSAADRELFKELRATVDAILVGAGTVRVERYGKLVREPPRIRRRRERGQPEQPFACIASASLSLPEDLPLLADPASRVVVLTPSAASLPPSAAEVAYVRSSREGELDFAGALAELRARFGVRTVHCEGGPHLAAELLAAGLIDELLLSISPLLAGGDPHSGASLRILAGAELDPPLELELLGVLEHDSCLFLRYAIRPPTSPARS